MAPLQLCNNLLHKFFSGRASAKALIYFRLRGLKPSTPGKLRFQVLGKPIDDLSCPSLPSVAQVVSVGGNTPGT